jgi:N-acetylneuraminic acid mutarotase
MKNFITLLLLVSTISSCQKQMESVAIQNNTEEQLSSTVPRSNYWTFKLFSPAWISRRSGMSCFVIGGYAYFFGGFDHANYSLNKDLYRYDPVTNTYTQKAGMPYPGLSRMQAVAFTINNKGYIATGYATGLLNDLWEYDPAVGWAAPGQKKRTCPPQGVGGLSDFPLTTKDISQPETLMVLF